MCNDMARAHGGLPGLYRYWEQGLRPPPCSVSIDEAAEHNELEIIQYLYDKGLATATSDAIDMASEQGDWGVVVYLLDNRTEGCTTRAMDAAARYGNLAMLQYFHHYRTEGCTTAALDDAAGSGVVDVVQYLHEQCHAPCTTRAMENAAAIGHLCVVQYLHENRMEGCTTKAIDVAARRGHLDVVKYLHQHRTEGCSIEGIQDEIKAQHHAVVSFLYQHYAHLFTPPLLGDLLLYGTFDVYMAMCELYPEEAEAVLSDVIFRAGQHVELPTIRFILEMLGKETLGQRALDGVARALVNSNDRLLTRKQLVEQLVRPGEGGEKTRKQELLLDPRRLSWEPSSFLLCVIEAATTTRI